MTLYEMNEITGIFVDAIVADEDHQLLFLSAWGLDTALQELIAKLSIPEDEKGLSTFFLRDIDIEAGGPCLYKVQDSKRLDKLTGRSGKDSLFAGLAHLWLYDKLVTNIDHANRRCVLLKQHTEDRKSFNERLWQTVRSVCTVPLLSQWHNIVEDFQVLGWIQHHAGIAVDAYVLNFGQDEVEAEISRWIQAGKYKLPKKTATLSLVKF